ncbi:MAG: tetratricopeptide repeat protein [Flavobacteriaceae bacterium]
MKKRHAIYRKSTVLLYIVIFCGLGALLHAQASMQPLFEEGNQAYNEGEYSKAVALYEQVLKMGQHSTALYFNLGNAHYRLNHVAESIFYYEKAKQLDPTNEAVIMNSVFAKNMTLDAIEPLPQTQLQVLESKLLSLFSLSTLGRITVVLFWLFVLLFLGYLFVGSSILKRTLFFTSLLALCLGIASFSIGIVKNKKEKELHEAILFSKQIDVWSEPNAQGELLFTLHEGTKIEWLDTLEEWNKIRIANGSEGWIKNAELRSLKENLFK